jgi:hypothetical protein
MSTKVKTTVTIDDISQFDIEELKKVLAKNGIDFERAVNIQEDGEMELATELDGKEIIVEGQATEGFSGSYWDPPEDPEMDISKVSKITFADKEIAIDEAFTEKTWEWITEQLWENKQDQYEAYLEEKAEHDREMAWERRLENDE